MGSSPWLGVGPAVPPVEGSVSRALITIDTKMLFSRELDAWPEHPANRSGHGAALGFSQEEELPGRPKLGSPGGR
eukprot:2238467-Rhodomonas_salina.1